MKASGNCIATKALLLLAPCFMGAVAYAAEIAGTVTHLSGPLLARKADGTAKILAQKSIVEQGDTLISEKDTYARIKFVDNGEITLRPNSQLKIDSFSFDEAKPEQDSATFSLIKGGLRAVTGLLGKRNKERVGVNTPTATIGIRGTIFIVEYVPPNEQAVAAYGRASMAAADGSVMFGPHGTLTETPRIRAPLDFLPVKSAAPLHVAQAPGGTNGRTSGLYVQVLDGMINLRNHAGSQDFAAGQFGYTATMQTPPVVLPANPGMQFAPPPAFSSSTGPQGGQRGNGTSSDVECEVR